MELRYLGFDQLRSARAFRFEIIVKGAITRQAVVTADMALFLQFRVGIQDGPTLCAGKLTADLENSLEGEHVLTADDLRAHSAARAAAEAKRLEARAAAGRRHHATTAAFENPRGRV
jgi:hypothetical protein